MKFLRELLAEANRMSGPEDYRPGDEHVVGSPSYGQRRGIVKPDLRGDPDYRAGDAAADRTREEQNARASAASHQGKLFDVQSTQEKNPNGASAPIYVKTGGAVDRETAEREIHRIKQAAWQTHDSSIEDLPDGRVKFMIKFTL